MITYIESFKILSKTLGIEDMKDGRPEEEHFFPKNAIYRYQLWAGGCGIGTADTLEEARRKIHDYTLSDALNKLLIAEKQIELLKLTISKLGTDPAYLFRFESSTIA